MANFNELIDRILEHEGKYVDHPADPGGATNMGITFAVFKKYAEALGLPKTKDGLKRLTVDNTKNIYYDEFWRPMRGDEFKDQQLAEQVYDFYVNAGKPALKMLQAELGVEADGEIGPVTISILNHANAEVVFNGYRDARIMYYKNLAAKKPKLQVFLKGWLNRANKFVYKKYTPLPQNIAP